MGNTAIKVENLSKIYRVGEIGTGTISRDMERWFKTKVLKQEDPFLKIGETNDRASKGKSDIVYSLQDINFEIQQGDAVGIIGRNGAGKSTLLKILSRVTTPTTGRINIKGRVASLLEVGTGFHPELTGRENIYLNGAILGMRKREIDRKLDEIIDFSGVERYIDTPVKRYSSGMYVRLAFAVAAHLESEILIVDEVLAVGDAEFQKKCLGKMGEVSKGEGRTVLFVSHNMAAIQQLCSKALHLANGMLLGINETSVIISEYRANISSKGNTMLYVAPNLVRGKAVQITRVELICLSESSRVNIFDIKDKLQLAISVIVLEEELEFIPLIDLIKDGIVIYRSYFSDTQSDKLNYKYPKGEYVFQTSLLWPLKSGEYQVNIKLGRVMIEDFEILENVISFEIAEIETMVLYKSYSQGRPGLLATEYPWSVVKM
jgi:lipopolysaccharide transport system ATP-binding protein